MAKVKFIGMLSFNINKPDDEIICDNINQLINKLSEIYPQISKKDLKNSLIFVNGQNICKLKMFKTKLCLNDEVIFASPVGGG